MTYRREDLYRQRIERLVAQLRNGVPQPTSQVSVSFSFHWAVQQGLAHHRAEVGPERIHAPIAFSGGTGSAPAEKTVVQGKADLSSG